MLFGFRKDDVLNLKLSLKALECFQRMESFFHEAFTRFLRLLDAGRKGTYSTTLYMQKCTVKIRLLLGHNLLIYQISWEL